MLIWNGVIPIKNKYFQHSEVSVEEQEQKKKKKKKGLEIDEESDFPVHEEYTREENTLQ